MSRRRFRRAFGAGLVAPVQPTVYAPAIISAVDGQALVFVSASADGAVQPTVTLTELLDASSAVIASAAGPTVSHTCVLGAALRVRQSYTLLGKPGVAVSQAVSVTAPQAVSGAAPQIVGAMVGFTVSYISAVAEGSTSVVLSTHLLDASDTVVASASGKVLRYKAQPGQVLRLRQSVTSDAGTVTLTSQARTVISNIVPHTDWDYPMPVAMSTAVALIANTQPGSRLFYISAADGVLPDAMTMYFWSGTAIIDATGSTTNAQGMAYGTDPYNPSSAVVANKFWSAVGPVCEGNAPGVRSGDGGGSRVNPGCTFYQNAGIGRDSAPDWWLFKRGEIFNLNDDNAGYRAVVPGWSAVGCGLSSPGGATQGSRQVFAGYGPKTTRRPRVCKPNSTHGSAALISRVGGTFRNVLFTDLEFDGFARESGVEEMDTDVASGVGLTSDSTGILFQNCFFNGMGGGDLTAGVNNQAQVEYFRCLYADIHSGYKSNSHISAIHSGGVPGSLVLWNQCVQARCGYANFAPGRVESPGAIASFPAYDSALAWAAGSIVRKDGEAWICTRDIAAGTAFVETTLKGEVTSYGAEVIGWRRISDNGGTLARGTVYDRAMYLDGPFVAINCISLRSSSGEQMRDGIGITDTFIQAGHVNYGNDSGTGPDNDAFSGWVEDTVIEMFLQSGLHVGSALNFMAGPRNVAVNRLIVSGAAAEPTLSALMFGAFGGPTDQMDKAILARTRNITAEDCIFDSGAAVPVRLVDGVRPGGGNINQQSWVTYPALKSIQVRNCILSSSFAGGDSTYTAMLGAPATNDAVFASNLRYTSRAAAAAALGWPAPNRTWKTYLQSLGVTVLSADGVHEAVAALGTLDVHNWTPAWTGNAINNYIRAGRGMASVPA